jgi:hypothetical protein
LATNATGLRKDVAAEMRGIRCRDPKSNPSNDHEPGLLHIGDSWFRGITPDPNAVPGLQGTTKGPHRSSTEKAFSGAESGRA